MRKIVKKYNKIVILTLVAAVMLTLVGSAQSVWAGVQLSYETRHPQTGEVIQWFSSEEEILPDGRRKVVWIKKKPGHEWREEYILAEDDQTEWWRVVSPDLDTDYQGERKGKQLVVKGRFMGASVDTILRIDHRPFYVNPKFGLRHFLKSGEKKRVFWGLRGDKLTVHLMVARDVVEEAVDIRGRSVIALRVDWTAHGMGSMFFKRRYWFRKSDFVYIRQIVREEYVRELVSDQN